MNVRRRRWSGYREWLGGLGLVVAIGCPSSPQVPSRAVRPPSRDDLEGIELETIEIELRTPGVSAYGQSSNHALNELERALVDRLADLSMVHRPELSRMARELAYTIPNRSYAPVALIDGVMAWAGVTDANPRMALVEIAADRPRCEHRVHPSCDAQLDSLEAQVRAIVPHSEPLAYGAGISQLPDGRSRVVVVIVEHAVVLDPMPVATRKGGSFTIAGTLHDSRTSPRGELTDPEGFTRSLPLSRGAKGRFTTQLACDGDPGMYEAEIMATGEFGPEIVAKFPLYCGVKPPDTITVQSERLDPSVGAEQIARAIFHYLNEARAARGLTRLQWDPQAADVARRHSRDMLDNGFVGHRSPSTGYVLARFEASGITSTVIRENVARGYGPKGIHDSLMGSPAHRANLLATDVTHIGIGVVLDQSKADSSGPPRPILATQNLYKKPGAGAPLDDLGPALQALVDAHRARQKLPPIQWNPSLSKIAQRRAHTLGKGRTLPQGSDEKIFALGYEEVESHRMSSPDFDALAEAEVWASVSRDVGLGVVRTQTKGDDEEFLAVVLVAR